MVCHTFTVEQLLNAIKVEIPNTAKSNRSAIPGFPLTKSKSEQNIIPNLKLKIIAKVKAEKLVAINNMETERRRTSATREIVCCREVCAEVTIPARASKAATKVII